MNGYLPVSLPLSSGKSFFKHCFIVLVDVKYVLEANRTTLNGLIRAGWTAVADGLCDVGNHGLMAQNGSEAR